MDIAIGVINVMMYFECYGIVNILVGNGCGVWEINRRSLGRAPKYIHTYIYIYIIYKYRRVGVLSSPLGRPPVTGKSFRVVRAFMRAEPMLGGNASQT
jgi:hypothetical protein